MTKKQCCICKQIKPLPEFYKNIRRKDGYQTYCKICDREYKRKYVNTPKAKERIKKYNQSELGKEIVLKAAQKYRKVHRMKLREKTKINYHKNPEKGHAKYKVFKAIEKGILKPATDFKCVCCEKQANKYHHHLGYAQEHCLSVQPVCNSCHTTIHLPRP